MQHDPRGVPLQRRSAIAMLGVACIPLAEAGGQSAEARMGGKVAEAVGAGEAQRMIAAFGPKVAGLSPTAFAACCSADFLEGRTLNVGGVMVARTEAVRWLLAAGAPLA